MSSSWGNGHATTFRALLKAFAARGHDILFLERDVPWYADNRDLVDPGYCRLAFYKDREDLRRWAETVAAADAVLVGSYVPEGVAVGRWAQETARSAVAFYDIDTPVTLAKLERGDEEYLSAALIPGFDIYFSFTGGPTLDHLMSGYGSPAARALYCSVDADVYMPHPVAKRWDLSYLGTYSPDRQPTLDRLLLEPARQEPSLRFVVAGPQYPDDIVWPENVERLHHVPPAGHPAFYAASRFTLNVTRQDMVRAGHSPSVRLFEAAACATPIISDVWDGLDELLELDREIIPARQSDDVLRALRTLGEAERDAMGKRARQRILAGHTAAHRAETLERELAAAARRKVRDQFDAGVLQRGDRGKRLPQPRW
nr:glycosyltransferase [Azospirillum melinis]